MIKVNQEVVEGKSTRLICSLSKRGDIGLMWTHYCSDNKGCCLEFEITSKSWERVEVVYKTQMPVLNNNTTVKDILSVKAKMWEYENEVRYLSPEIEINPVTKKLKKRLQLSIKILRVFIGCKVDRSKKAHLKKIIKALDENIEYVDMKIADLDYGYK